MVFGQQTKIWHPELSTLLDCTIGDRCTVHSHVWIGNNVIVGNDCKIQAFAFIPDGVTLSDHVFIGPAVVFTNDKHPPSDTWRPTHVGPWVSIGANATILPGICIGAHAVIGAGSVVTRDVEIGEVVYGNPARPVRRKAVA